MKKIVFLVGISSVLVWGFSGSLSSAGSSTIDTITATGTTSGSASTTGASGSASGNITFGNYNAGGSESFDVLFNKYSSISNPFNTSNSFDVTDVNKNYLTTKVANKPFKVEIKSKNNYIGIVRVDIIKNPANQQECENNPALNSRYVIMPYMKNVILSDIFPNIIKDAKFRVRYLDKFPKSCVYLMQQNSDINVSKCVTDLKNEKKTYITNCIDKLSANPTPYQVIQCIFNNANSSCSNDDFAIRPDHFGIKVDTTQPIKAGNDFNVTLTAYDYHNNLIKNYDGSVSIKGLSALLDYVDANTSKGAITGKLSFADNKHSFVNGEANLTLRYSEVGDLNLTVKETNDTNTYAYVDRNDTALNQLLITPASTLITFIPDHFDINATYHNFKNSDFTYVSNDLNMSSVLDVNITAENEQNQTTKNYNNKCYAKNFDINISHSIPSELNESTTIILYKYENGSEHNVSLNSDINFNLAKSYFTTDHNGTANLKFKINFKRNPAIPVNEFNFTIKDINITDEDDINGTKNLDKNATFRYGRIDVQNVSGYSRELNTTYQYEYWTNNGWIINKNHNSSIFGDVNETNSYHPFIDMDVNHNIKDGKEDTNLSTTHAIPYSTKIHLAIPSWLWYNPLAENYKAPSSTNQNCLTHPCEIVIFNKVGMGWGGIGQNNVKYSEANRTAEINASIKNIKSNKAEVKKINW